MKVKIEFELDLSGTSYNIENEKGLQAGLQELGSWFNGLHLHSFEAKMDMLRTLKDMKYDERTLAALRAHYDEVERISSQLFNNYKVEGKMEDGKSFVFTHKEPGYRETLKVEENEVIT
jgi:hypothetical protein